MTKTGLNIDIDCITELFTSSQEACIIVGEDKKITYMNIKASSLLGKPASVAEIEHLITFDAYALDRENRLNFNPLQEAVLTKEKMYCEVVLQLAEDEYRNFHLRSFKNKTYTVILMAEIFEQKAYQEKILELEGQNRDYLQLQEEARKLAVRTGLTNRISNSIRQSLELDKIIEIALSEISTTLGLDKSYFAFYDGENFSLKNSWNFENVDLERDSGLRQAVIEKKTQNSMVMTDSGIAQSRLIVPVLYRDNPLGVMVFYLAASKKEWHEEEISLIEGLSAQLATAISQAELFETALRQKKELEEALIELKAAQSQLVQSEKMASLGQLVAGVAHEINTPLGAINSNNGILAKCVDKNLKDNDIAEIAENAISVNKEAIRRISNLVKSLKNFARLDEAEYQEVNIHDGIKSTLTLISHELKNKIAVIEEFGKLPPMKCFPNALNQVFMNILINACQSIEDTGSIRIKTDKQGKYAVITISDTGKGISKEDWSRVFDPGFTTKGVGVGTGLGLSICYQIIEKHNGNISVKSEVGKGTEFKIEIPL